MKFLKTSFLVFLMVQLSACASLYQSQPPHAAMKPLPPPTAEQTYAMASSGDNRVFFDFNQSTLSDVDQAKLNKIAVFLKVHPKQNLTLKGHIDKIEELNTSLAENRLTAVADYLEKQGVDEKRLVLINKSYQEPLAFGCTDALKNDNVCAVNRRVLLMYS